MSDEAQKTLNALRAKREQRRHFESCTDELFSALQGVLLHAVNPVDLECLKKGIGTSTPKGKALLAARAALAKAIEEQL